MSPQCQHCGTDVTHDYARVLGDEDGTVHRCPSCDSQHRRWRGSSAGADIDRPDPAEQPNRNRGYRTDEPVTSRPDRTAEDVTGGEADG